VGAESKRAMRTGVAFSGGVSTARFPAGVFAPSFKGVGKDVGEGAS
jgi:hypothetical protein